MDILLKLFLVNWFINILLVEFSLAKLKRIIDVDEKRDTQFAAFRRNDVKWFNRLWLYPTCHFAFFKIMTTFIMIFFCSTFASACTYGQDMDKPITGIRRILVRINFYFSCKYAIWTASSCVWIFNERPKVCYKKYLGPDWVADYDWQHCSTVVCNHSAFLDSLVHGL